MLWILPLDVPEPGGYPLTNDSAYKQKRSVSPVKRKDISATIAPGGINTQAITSHTMPKPEREKPKKNLKKDPQTTRPSKTVSFVTSNLLETKSSKW